jgi:hypothetical protein
MEIDEHNNGQRPPLFFLFDNTTPGLRIDTSTLREFSIYTTPRCSMMMMMIQYIY